MNTLPSEQVAASGGLPPTLLPVRGLLFAMGDVLYDATVWRLWLLRLLANIGLRTHYRAFFRVWDDDFLPAAHCGLRSRDEALADFLRSVGLSPGQVDEVLIASGAKRRILEATLRPLPGVRAAISRLAVEQIRLGVLSDSDLPASDLRRRLEVLRLPGFTTVVSSRETGFAKPAPQGYRLALQQMELAPAHVAFVGRDAQELAGARALGMPTIAFNYEAEVSADLCLNRLDTLTDLLAQRRLMAAAS